MTPGPAEPSVEIDLDAGPLAADDAMAVLHRAFDEYTAKGETAGVMLETPDTLREELAAGTGLAVARLDGRIVAVAKHHATEDGFRYFGRLGVDPAARGRGLAGALVRALRDDARVAGLAGLTCTVRAVEEGNIALYRRLGMEVVGCGERVSRTGATIPVVEMRDA
ncbi:GNAT family N-acetyltransferase [Demequina subtropica]|uniref:GNAT family N-acetyltransferase n=1 Tax=Demequina subtropica TaxID=1638989 RepID=UPI0007853193|nr:GNAT family N-acetyltransferase [Demequina subtropica]